MSRAKLRSRECRELHKQSKQSAHSQAPAPHLPAPHSTHAYIGCRASQSHACLWPPYGPGTRYCEREAVKNEKTIKYHANPEGNETHGLSTAVFADMRMPQGVCERVQQRALILVQLHTSLRLCLDRQMGRLLTGFLTVNSGYTRSTDAVTQASKAHS